MPWSRRLVEPLLHVERSAIDPWIAVRNAAGVGVALGAGFVVSRPAVGVAGALGALMVSYSDGRDPYVSRGARMAVSSVLCAAATLAGATAAESPLVGGALATLWAFASGLASAFGPAVADLGTFGLLMCISFASTHLSRTDALQFSAVTLAGGLLQTGLALLLWPLHRYEPERRELGRLYLALGTLVDRRSGPNDPPPASAEMSRAHEALSTLPAGSSLETERLRSLLTQAERIRLGLVALSRWPESAAPRIAGGPPVAAGMATASAVLVRVGESLLTGAPIRAGDTSLVQLEAFVAPLRDSRGPGDRDDVVRAFEALAGQLRAVASLASRSTPRGTQAFEAHEAKRPWRFRFSGVLPTLRANLNLRSTAYRHAVRLALAVALGEAVGRALHLERAYWVPMTVGLVLKPDYGATFTRGILRIGGTFAGLLFATALFHVLPPNQGLYAALVLAFTLVLRSFGRSHYGLFTLAISSLVVVLAALVGTDPAKVIVARGVGTLLGGGIALAAYAAWPTWERTQVGEATAQLLDAYREYLHSVAATGVGSQAYDDAVHRARLATRVTRSNLTASLERVAREPGTSLARRELFSAILAAGNRLAFSIMAFDHEEGLGLGDAASQAFATFARHAEETLSGLSANLRASAETTARRWPNLRADYDEVARTNRDGPPYVTTEVDLAANSLNTLRELVAAFVAGGSGTPAA